MLLSLRSSLNPEERVRSLILVKCEPRRAQSASDGVSSSIARLGMLRGICWTWDSREGGLGESSSVFGPGVRVIVARVEDILGVEMVLVAGKRFRQESKGSRRGRIGRAVILDVGCEVRE